MRGFDKNKLYKRHSYMRQQAGYEKYFIYGVLILVCLLIIGGLLAALTHREEGLLGRNVRKTRMKEKKKPRSRTRLWRLRSIIRISEY